MHYSAKVFGKVEQFDTMDAAESWRGKLARQLGAHWPDTSLRHIGADEQETLCDAPTRDALRADGCDVLPADHPRTLAVLARQSARDEADRIADKMGSGFDRDPRWIDAVQRAHAAPPAG